MTLYAGRRPKSKRTRVAPRHGGRFGVGILPSAPAARPPAPLSDLEWHATMAAVYGEDARAAASRALDLIERSLIPDDALELIRRMGRRD